TAARFAETGVAQRLDPEMRELLPVGHPHNSFLQVWAELGLPGAFLAGLALMLMLRAVAGYPPGAFAAAIGLAAAAAA
ncbi:O-antigen ligase family protein, partial [Stenotrophomonas maltophilia]